MAKMYYTLLTRENAKDKWSVEFGSYEKKEVEYEKEEYKDKGVKTKIIKTGDKQANIDKAVNELNAKIQLV